MVNYRDRHLGDKQSIVHVAWQTEGCGYLTLTIMSSHKLQCGSSGLSLCWHLKTCVFISGREHNYNAGFWSHSKNVSFLGLLYIWPHSQSMLKWLQVKSLMAPSPTATFPTLVQTWRMLYVHLCLGGCTIYRSTPAWLTSEMTLVGSPLSQVW